MMRHPEFKPTIDGLIHHIAARFGDSEAIVRDGRRLTYRELEKGSADIARALLERGVSKGTRIGLMMPPTPEFVLFMLAIGRIGAVVVPLSTLYQAPELSWVLANGEVDHLVVADRFLNHDYLVRLEEALPGLAGSVPPYRLHVAPRLRTIWVTGEESREWSRPAAELQAGSEVIDDAMLRAIEDKVSPADPLVIIHTSGSTANPKGVIHGHGPFVRHSYQMSMDFYPFGAGDRVLTTRAMFWVAGLVATLFYALQAGACVITTSDGSPANVLRLIEEERAMGLAGDSGWFDVLRQSDELSGAGYDVVRLNMDKAAFAREGRYLSPQVERRYGAPRHIPTGRIARTYGMTETLGGHTSARWDELLPEDRPSWQGRALPGVELRIIDPETRAILPPGETGELLVRGYCLMLGLTGKERNEVFDEEGYYATGDLCTLDADGYLKFESRMGEMIKIHGANVAPIEVELAMTGLLGIEKAAVVGVPRGEELELTAAVLMAPGRSLDAAAVTAELKQKLSSFKVPKRIVCMDEATLPMTGSGKIKKGELLALLQLDEG